MTSQRLRMPDRPGLPKFIVRGHPASHPRMCERGFTKTLFMTAHIAKIKHFALPCCVHPPSFDNSSHCLVFGGQLLIFHLLPFYEQYKRTFMYCHLDFIGLSSQPFDISCFN